MEIVIYQTEQSIWRANKPKRNNMVQETKENILRLLFMQIDQEDVYRLEEIMLVKWQNELAQVLYDALEDNPNTRIMN